MSWSIFLVVSVQLLEDSPQVKQRGLVCDPLRLNLRFLCDGKDSNYFDDIMCEGKCFRWWWWWLWWNNDDDYNHDDDGMIMVVVVKISIKMIMLKNSWE